MGPEGIGRMVRWARKRSGMSQAALAQASRMPQSTIARIERGTVVPRGTTLVQLLEATGYELTLERTLASPTEPDEIDEWLALAVPRRTHQALGVTRGRKDPIQILRRLRRFGVRFVLIGAIAEAAQGVPGRIDRMVEVCHARDPENVDRLRQALGDLGTEIDAEVLASLERTSVATPAGRLVLDPMPVAGDDYDILLRTARRTLVYTSLAVWLASIDDLIRIRRPRGRTEDGRALATLSVVRDRIDAGRRPRSRRTSTGTA